MLPKAAVELARDDLRSSSALYDADEFNISWHLTLWPMWEPEGQQVMIPTRSADAALWTRGVQLAERSGGSLDPPS